LGEKIDGVGDRVIATIKNAKGIGG
jgi:hypothetical protein